MAKYRAGIIGCGRRGDRRGGGYGIAEAHTWGYEACEQTEIVAAADLSTENLGIYCDEHNVASRYTDYKEMLEKEQLDIVSVCTWPQLHAPMTIAAANAKVKGVLCEKPIALILPEADAMLDACAANGVRLSVDHQRRLGEPFRVAKEIALSGDIGELIRIEAYVAGSNLYDWGTHWLDMMFFYLDETPAEWVAGQVTVGPEKINWGVRVEEHSIVHIQYKNGVRGYLEVGQPIKGQQPMRLVGTEGWVELLPPDRENPDQQTVRAKVKGRGEWLIPATTETIHARTNFSRAVQDLVDAIDAGRESELRGSRARAVLEVIVAAFESSLKGGRVSLPVVGVDYSPLARLVEAAK